VFDGIDACPKSGLDTILPFRMSHHEFVRPVCYLYGCPHLLFAQFLHIEVAHGIGNATRRHQFYPVGTVLDVVSNSRRDTVHRVRKIGARGQSLVRRQSVGVAMTACDRNEVTGRNHSRPLDQAHLDAVAQC
jgi:hypothetical protein